MKIFLRFFGMMMGLLLVATAQAAPLQQTTNLLQNPGFERPFINTGIADNWQSWSRNDSAANKDPDCLNGYSFSPKWNMEASNTDFIHQGFSSQHIGNNWDTWQGGVYQTLSVSAVSTYRFSFFARVRGSNEALPAASESTLQANIRAGIDPNGSGLWNDADVVWGNAGSPHDTWQQFSIETVATGNQLTVFTAANWGVQSINQCRQFLDSWFDSAELVEVLPPATDTPPPPPTSPPPPPATNTPIPTATSDIPATATTAPTATAVPTNTPLPGATICVNAFNDSNANGLRDESEGYIAGITFRVGNLDELIGQAVSLGTAEAICFDGVPPGSYQVSQIVPANLQMTTAPSAILEVEEGKTYGVEFGSRLPPAGSNLDPISTATVDSSASLPTAIPPTSPSTPSASSGINWLVVGGIFVGVIAILAVGAFIFLVLRRQPGE